VCCADGGANRLYDLLADCGEAERSKYLPNAIVGDLDSVRVDVLSYYEKRGVKVFRKIDQDSTDLEKSLSYLVSQASESTKHKKPSKLIVYGAFGGRMD
jgi:thiamine pyrophosphokinase